MQIKAATMEDYNIAFDYFEKLWTFNTYDYEETKKVYEKVLRIVDENFSYDSVFAFLKSGVVKSLEQSEIEMLENYVLARGG